ncbi:histone deacetylase HDT1 [Daucus carota subsp. sativus]|uniref:histone deacetylase HDT1 n=1 Tax=Daucus carota subsp. sativus TaxID=79200 RepID=UPI0007EF18F1|nr:PREDICTED: histone deacetylase HDT1-like [Daucus carota subsp. sativus]
MEFWGVEVKAGEKVPVPVESGHLIHVSQVALGDVKNAKAANYVPVRMTVEGKKFVIGTLSADKGPQISFDLVLDKDFELSHDWKDGSIYFCGYSAEQDDGTEGPDGFYDEEDSSDEEEIELENGKPVPAIPAAKATESKAAATKPGSSAKPKVTVVEPKKDESEDDSDDSDDSESDPLEDDSSDDDDMSEDEETPQKVEPPSKKRPASSAVKTPASTKKAKTETPQKTDGKKASVHTATPHPKKKSEKKTTESPKSSGGVTCSSCSKTFNSEKGLESHSKAKHGGK